MKSLAIFKNGGFRANFVGIYIYGVLQWEDTEYGGEFEEKLLELLQQVSQQGHRVEVLVEDVPYEVARAMGLSRTYPKRCKSTETGWKPSSGEKAISWNSPAAEAAQGRMAAGRLALAESPKSDGRLFEPYAAFMQAATAQRQNYGTRQSCPVEVPGRSSHT